MTTFLGAWPILDEDRTLDELVREADEELVVLAWQSGVVLTAEPEWKVREGHIIGTPSLTGLYLCCEAPARLRAERRALAPAMAGVA